MNDDEFIPLAQERTNRPTIEAVCGRLEDLRQYQEAAALAGEVTLLLGSTQLTSSRRYHVVPVSKPRRVAQWKRETNRRFR